MSAVAPIEHVPERHIGELLARAAARFPLRPAIQTEAGVSTYAQLKRSVDATVDDLRRLGALRGDRVIVVGGNTLGEVALLFALNELGCWPLLLNSRLAPQQLAALIEHCTPRLTLFVGSQAETLAHAARHDAGAHSFTSLDAIRVARAAAPTAREPSAAVPDLNVAAMICTSGTTGTPKIAMLSHRYLLFAALTQRRVRRYTHEDKTYCPLPLSHVAALGFLLCVVASGACLYLRQRFVPGDLARAIRVDGITVVPGLPPLHRKFVEWVAENPGEFSRGRVRLVTTSSSPLDDSLKRSVEELYGCMFQNAYGSTETGLVFQVDVDHPRVDTSVGRAVPGVDVRLVDSAGRDVPVGEPGEILVRGRNVFLGYYRAPAATKAAFTADGWLRTGDVARVDSTGAAFITGRAKESIKRSGYTVYPDGVEQALAAHSDVALAAVVSGQREGDSEIVAFVELKKHSTSDARALLAFASQRLAPYELPGIIEIVPQLPTLANNKIDRSLLRQLAEKLTRSDFARR
jgi:acyl-CoA synthetase (AMP-forming)/AMP-acid ligase II